MPRTQFIFYNAVSGKFGALNAFKPQNVCNKVPIGIIPYFGINKNNK